MSERLGIVDRAGGRRWGLWAVMATAAILLAGVLLMCWPAVIGPFGDSDQTLVSARVSKSVPCDSADPRDEVVYGQNQRVTVSSCGERVGEQIEITLPAGGQSHAQVADTVRGTGGAYRPVGFVLLTLAGFAGAGSVLLLGPRRSRSTS